MDFNFYCTKINIAFFPISPKALWCMLIFSKTWDMEHSFPTGEGLEQVSFLLRSPWFTSLRFPTVASLLDNSGEPLLIWVDGGSTSSWGR